MGCDFYMSEQSGGLDRIKSRFKSIIPHHMQEKTPRDQSESIAREAVLLFADQEHQESLATYYADSESVFELNKQKPGTILRFLVKNKDLEDAYHWYVTGTASMGKIDIFQINNFNATNISIPIEKFIESYKKFYMSPNLQLNLDWNLEKIELGTRDLSIGDLWRQLNKNGAAEVFINGFKMELQPTGNSADRVDIMNAGKTAKILEKETSKQPKLVPVNERA